MAGGEGAAGNAVLWRITNSLIRTREKQAMSCGHDHGENEPMEGRRPGGFISDVSGLVDFVHKNGPLMERLLKFGNKVLDKIESEGGLAIHVFGFELMRIKL